MSAEAAVLEIPMAQYVALAEFRYALHRFLRFSERAAEQAGLTPRQYQLLLAVHALGNEVAASISNVAEWLQVRHQTAVELVDRTSARGLVARRADPLDSRRVLVSLTPAGYDSLASLAVLHRDELRELAPMLVRTLQRLLAEQRLAPQHPESEEDFEKRS